MLHHTGYPFAAAFCAPAKGWELDDHAQDVAETLEGRACDPGRSARFVRAFVRPGGVDVPATTRFVDALEALGAQPAPAPQAAPAWTGILRPMLRPFATAAAARVRRLKDERRRRKDEILAEHRRRRRVEHKIRQPGQNTSGCGPR